MKKIKLIFGGVLFASVFFMLNVLVSLAAEAEIPQQGVEVATVDIKDVSMLSKEGHALSISFTLVNRVGVQPGVKYGVHLVSSEKNILTDQVIYPEVVSLGEGEEVKKEVTYLPAEYLKGKYQVWVVSQNESGLPLGVALAGEINLNGDEKFVSLDLTKCFLTVSGDKKEYLLTQGVAVSSEDELTLDCPTTNFIDENISVFPIFVTNFRSAFGKEMSEEQGDEIQFNAREKKNLKLNIYQAKIPQAYDLRVYLADKEGKQISNLIFARYVVRGTSATIRNAVLNKSNYQKNEVAILSLFWSGKADNFAADRAEGINPEKGFLKVSAKGQDGTACVTDFQKEFELQSGGEVEKIPLEIKNECFNGKFLISLVDARGSILDEKFIDFNQIEDQEKSGNIVKSSSLPFPYLVGILACLMGLILIAVWKIKGKNSAERLTIFLVLVGGLMISGQNVRAGTFVGPPYEGYRPVFYASLDKASYCKESDIRATGWADSWGSYCSYVEFKTSATINGSTQSLGFTIFDGNEQFCQNGNNTIISKNFTAQNSLGNFSAIFTGEAIYSSTPSRSSVNHEIGYSVVDCDPPASVDGRCGNSHENIFSSAPTTGLCDVGKPSNPVLNAAQTRWIWTCNGFSGGDPASCYALVSTPKVSFTFGNDSVLPRTIKLNGGAALKWIPQGSTWCRGWSNNTNNDGNWTTPGDGLPNVDVKTAFPNSQIVSPSSVGEYVYWIRCGNNAFRESEPKSLNLRVIEECSNPDPNKNECIKIDNCAGKNCVDALETAYCVDECGDDVPIVDGRCGNRECKAENIKCPCYDGNWKEVQP